MPGPTVQSRNGPSLLLARCSGRSSRFVVAGAARVAGVLLGKWSGSGPAVVRGGSRNALCLQGVSAAFRIRRSFGCGCGAVTPDRIMLAVERAGRAQAGAAAQFGSRGDTGPPRFLGQGFPLRACVPVHLDFSSTAPSRRQLHSAGLARPIVQVQDDAGGRRALWRGQLQDAGGAVFGDAELQGDGAKLSSDVSYPGDRSRPCPFGRHWRHRHRVCNCELRRLRLQAEAVPNSILDSSQDRLRSPARRCASKAAWIQ